MVYLLGTQKIQSHVVVRGMENPDNADPSFYYHMSFQDSSIPAPAPVPLCGRDCDASRSYLEKLNSHHRQFQICNSTSGVKGCCISLLQCSATPPLSLIFLDSKYSCQGTAERFKYLLRTRGNSKTHCFTSQNVSI